MVLLHCTSYFTVFTLDLGLTDFLIELSGWSAPPECIGGNVGISRQILDFWMSRLKQPKSNLMCPCPDNTC